MPQERPSPGTPCIVDACDEPATVLIDISDGDEIDGETAVAMCDMHADHWQRR
jgi:hypothetical protein